MPTFALVAEGVTDQIVIDAIISEICGDDAEVNYVQPIRDVSDAKTAPHGGWGLVFEYCTHRIQDAFAVNDFVVVHLDTDCGDDENFGLPLTKDGKDRSSAELVAEAATIIESRIDPSVLASFPGKLLFAVAVHSTECWLLLILYDVEREKGCFDRLRHELSKADGIALKKEARTYTSIARQIKKKRLGRLAKSGTSLGEFIRAVSAHCP